MKKSNKFSPEVRERAVRMALEHRGEYPSLWAATQSIAPKIGCVPHTLYEWVRRHEVDTCTRDGVTTAKRSRWGFWKCFNRLRKDGRGWNHKRVHRVYCQMKLNLKRKARRRTWDREKQPLQAPNGLNKIWSIDFMHDATYDGRTFRTLNVIDEGNREGLRIECGKSIPSARVVRVMTEPVEVYGRPDAIRLDNGPEFTADTFADWAKEQGIALLYIQPGKPECVHRTFQP
jgi:transposase InsO family protein